MGPSIIHLEPKHFGYNARVAIHGIMSLKNASDSAIRKQTLPTLYGIARLVSPKLRARKRSIPQIMIMGIANHHHLGSTNSKIMMTNKPIFAETRYTRKMTKPKKE